MTNSEQFLAELHAAGQGVEPTLSEVAGKSAEEAVRDCADPMWLFEWLFYREFRDHGLSERYWALLALQRNCARLVLSEVGGDVALSDGVDLLTAALAARSVEGVLAAHRETHEASCCYRHSRFGARITPALRVKVCDLIRSRLPELGGL